jgi:hypothetical protein
MTFRVYSGPRGSQSIAPLEKDRHLLKEFSTLDEAMSWARPINNGGRVTLLIEGDGTRLTKQQIVTALKNPDSGSRRRNTPHSAATRFSRLRCLTLGPVRPLHARRQCR